MISSQGFLNSARRSATLKWVFIHSFELVFKRHSCQLVFMKSMYALYLSNTVNQRQEGITARLSLSLSL